jgi:membrane fusion protein, multidrug efflux system
MAKHISGTTKEMITRGGVAKEKTLDRFDGVNGSRTPCDRLINQRTEGQFILVTNRVIALARGFQIFGWWMAVAGISFYLAACSKPQAASPGPPAPEVTVSKATEKEVVNWDEFTGRTAAVNLVTVTPRVSGYIVDIPFKEGGIVHKGDLLFQIDTRPYQHAYEQAVGQLQQAQANQQLQQVTFERQEHLKETGVIAKEDYDTALSNKSQSTAQVISAQAALDSAKLNLEFTHVTSPIDGRASRQLVNIGNLVQADVTQLTTIVSINPIYAYFSMDELAALKYQRLIQEGKVASSENGQVPVYLQLQDETGFPHEGALNFSDNTFDPTTGTLLVRGSFANPDGFLAPGSFVRVRIASSPKYKALLISDRAIGTDQDQSFVYVVDSKNIAHLRHITTGQIAEGLRVVKSGVQADDVLIINGIIKVRPDSPVKPQQGSMEQFTSNDISVPLTSAKSGGSEESMDRNKKTP